MYICECGKEFETPNSFNGHKSHCRVHAEACGKLDKFLELDNQRKEVLSKAYHQRLEFEQKKIVKKLEQWISEQHTCERCGKVMVEKFGSGRFCCRACANSHDRTEESKGKTSESARNKIAYTDPKGTVHYIREGEFVPEGWVKGNFQKCKDTKLKDFLTDNLSSKQKKQETRRAELVKSLLNPITMPFSLLKKNYKTSIKQHNDEILYNYEKFLKDKAENKVFNFNSNTFIFAKYPSVTMDHPRGHEGHVFVHILLAECLLDRSLNEFEIVHHKDENKENNSFENIYIFDTKSSHTRFHNNKLPWLEIKGDVLVCKDLTREIILDNFVNV